MPPVILSEIRPQTRGYLLALVGVIAVTPDGLLVRIASDHSGGSFWWIICIKCLCLSTMILCVQLIQHGIRKVIASVSNAPWDNLIISFWNAMVTVGFPASIQLTTAAKALLLISLNLLWSALLGWRVLGDKLPRRTLIALVGGAAAALLIVIPPIIAPPSSQAVEEPVIAADGVGNWRGDVLALATGISLASLVTTTRLVNRRRPQVLGAVAVALGALGAGLALLVFACITAPAAPAAFRPSFWVAVLADAVCVGSCTVLALTWAPKYISPAEVALVLLLENLGAVWVALGGYETPSIWTVVGGAMLLLVLGTHQVAAVREGRHAPTSNMEQRRDDGGDGTAGEDAGIAANGNAKAVAGTPGPVSHHAEAPIRTQTV